MGSDGWLHTPDCVWDGTHRGMQWSVDDVDIMALDKEAEKFLEIREYMDSLVEEERLNTSLKSCRKTSGDATSPVAA